MEEQEGLLEERFAEAKRVVDILVEAVSVVHAGGQESRVLIDERKAGIGGEGAAVVDPVLIALEALGGLVVEEDEIVASGWAGCVLVDIEGGEYGGLAEIFIVLGGQRNGELSHAITLDSDRLCRNVHKFLL